MIFSSKFPSREPPAVRIYDSHSSEFGILLPSEETGGERRGNKMKMGDDNFSHFSQNIAMRR